jgi:hypothetical protein
MFIDWLRLHIFSYNGIGKINKLICVMENSDLDDKFEFLWKIIDLIHLIMEELTKKVTNQNGEILGIISYNI